MENKKSISIYVGIITVLVIFVTIIGIASINFKNEFSFTTIYGDVVKIYGGGIYKMHTVAQVYQVIPHDMVNLFLALPALLISFAFVRKGILKAKLFFMGVTLYLLFTYGIYTFYTMYNRLYLCYVAIMGLCFFMFLITLKGTDATKVEELFKDNYPNKLVGGFLITAASFMTLTWLKQIMPTVLFNNIPTIDLAQSATMVPQAIDLAFVLPLAFLMGIRLCRKKPEAYIMGTVVPAFLVFMMTAIFSKGLMLQVTNTENGIGTMVIMGTFAVIALIITIINFRYMKKEG
ncbi:hypothetical protein V6C42_00055 [Pseudoclostridium thermosuccinogenes]|uniref:hypothetical protein n=1 Tax=Clostridium thermosuccinogenes TaxID=84032 RepID=UPI002FD9EB5D